LEVRAETGREEVLILANGAAALVILQRDEYAASHQDGNRRKLNMGVIDSRVRNIGDLTLEHFKKGEQFESRSARIGPLLGARDLGYSYDVVPPGKRSCPFHSHRGEEEMFFILRGEGTLRFGEESRRVRAGDVICCPTGGPETAHQLINDSSAELAYLSVSTMMPSEVCEYPDSNKIGAFGGPLRHLTHADHNVDYWTGEL
jgi:uncharacterized cupin superfamily protein